MSEDNNVDPTAPKETIVTNAPNAVGPNCEFAISPAGLIRCAFSDSVLMSAFYVDAEAARIIGGQFTDMADRLDEAYEQLREMQQSVPQDTVDNSIQDAPVDDATETSDQPV